MDQTAALIHLLTQAVLLASGFHTHKREGERHVKEMTSNNAGQPSEKIERVRAKFADLLAKTNKEHPRPQDVKALSDLVYNNKGLQLWRDVASAGQLAELTVIENSTAVAGLKECLRHRLQGLKKDPGNEGAPLLTTLDSTRCVVLAEVESCRITVFECDEAINHTYFGYVLGETPLGRSKTIHSRLRDSHTSQEVVSNNSYPAGQYAALGGQQVNLAPKVD